MSQDEAAARECLLPKNLVPYSDDRIPAIKPEEWGSLVDNYLGGPMGKRCARHDPTRVLAECAAKRAIIALFNPDDKTETWDGEAWRASGIEDALLALAAVYADHPDYRQEWA